MLFEFILKKGEEIINHFETNYIVEIQRKLTAIVKYELSVHDFDNIIRLQRLDTEENGYHFIIIYNR